MNLVVGMSANYGVAELRNFVCSFKQHQGNDLLLMLQNNDRETRDWLHAKGVLTVDVAMDIHPEFARYFALHELLRTYPEYTRVFHCDVRDAVAQADIFAQVPDPGLHVFLEESTVPIGENRVNSAWITMAYDEETLARYAAKAVICCGTTLGDRESFCVYAQAMTDEFERLLALKGPDYMVYHVRDQALHMHLVYSGELSARLAQVDRPLILHENGDGVFTLGKAKEFSVNKACQVRNPDRTVPAVVHQYDRYAFLREMFDTVYANE